MVITLGKLRKIIDSIPKELDHAIVVCQKDSEGNGYSPLSCVDDNAVYIPDSTWSGSVYDRSWAAHEACMEKEEWEELINDPKKRAIILAPVN